MAYGPQPLVNIPKNFVSNRVRSTRLKPTKSVKLKQAVPYSSLVNFMKLDLELNKTVVHGKLYVAENKKKAHN